MCLGNLPWEANDLCATEGTMSLRDSHRISCRAESFQGRATRNSKAFRELLPGILLFLGLVVWLSGSSGFGNETFFGPIWPSSFKTSIEERDLWKKQLEEVEAFLQAYSRAMKAAVKLVGPSVVHIDATGTQSRSGVVDNRQRQEDSGAGILIRLSGKMYVLTNRHVVNKATANTIKIRLVDGQVLQPLAVWSDADSDVALLPLPDLDLPPAELGNSDEVEVGDFVLAVGSPFGLRHTVTFGIVSAVRRRGLQLGHAGLRVQDFLQTDAAINPGNSGGPLVNLKGQVIGLNTAIASNSGGNEGVGFAIPINLAIRVATQLAENGRVRWGYLGVNLEDDLSAEKAAVIGLPRPCGAFINQVVPGGPASAGGLRNGDVILKFGDTWVEDDDHLIYLVSVTSPGESVPMLVWRDRRQVVVTVQLGERSPQ